MYIELFFVFFSSLTTLYILRKIAKRVGLVDKPNQRKTHEGLVPLVGGLSICIVLVQFLFYNDSIINYSGLYSLSIIILVIVGVIDDKYDLNFKVRLFVQAILSFLMIHFAGIKLLNLGNMFGFGVIDFSSMHMTYFAYFITIIAVIGAINAFNMVDGIDGLLGGLSIVTFSSLAIVLKYDGQDSLALFCLVIIVAIIPYVLFNLGLMGRKRKVFMGDAGSMLIGFTIIWLLLSSSQGAKAPLRPVTALWLIAIPLMDMAAIMIRRIRRGDSPFKPDREHLHHIFQRIGFSSHQTLGIISLLAFVFAMFGIYGEIINIPEYIMFLLFLTLFLIYFLMLSYSWRILTLIRKIIKT
ncbi:undecaprenyl-phosphate alpha-N-acetylglucosaminyl 1-phosphate transferase [Photobacterium leiognathi subsp. mandapamensis]|nr:undecaprenyl-phosphate alpha-N-acetylglucosaminyl 1-phosphate transferase [Photobacterium leiognathi subsp. mandapamensis]